MKRNKTDNVKVFLVTLLAMGFVVALLMVEDGHRRRNHRAAATEFQQLVGGLGLGPDTNWERCPHNFDLRTSAACSFDAGPLPGGAAFCPHRTISLLATSRWIDNSTYD